MNEAHATVAAYCAVIWRNLGGKAFRHLYTSSQVSSHAHIYVQCADCNQSLHVQGTEAHLQATECSGTVRCSRRGVLAAEGLSLFIVNSQLNTGIYIYISCITCAYMYVYVYVYVYAYVYVYLDRTHIHIHVHIHIYMCICTYICVYICICIYIYICSCSCIYTYIYIRIHIHIYLSMFYLYMYTCMYVHLHT